MNATDLLLVMPAAFVFTFKTPTFDINKLMSVSLAAVPAVTNPICCPADSQACVVILFVTLCDCQRGIDTLEKPTYKAIAPAEPVPSLRFALLAVLSARPAAVHAEMAAVSAASREAAFTPPVPSFAIAAIAAVEIVRVLGAATPARTVAILVVLKTEACVDANKESTTIENGFMVAVLRVRERDEVLERATKMKCKIIQNKNDQPAEVKKVMMKD